MTEATARRMRLSAVLAILLGGAGVIFNFFFGAM